MLIGLAGDDAFRAVLPCRPFWSKRLAALVVFGSGTFNAGFASDFALRAVISSGGVRPEMLGIMARMNQKDRYAARCRAHRRLQQWHVQGWSCWYAQFFCRLAKMLGIMTVTRLVLFKVVDIPVMPQRLFLMVEIPQSPYIWCSMLLSCSSGSRSWRRGISHGPDCSADHCDSSVTLRHGGQYPCFSGRAG